MIDAAQAKLRDLVGTLVHYRFQLQLAEDWNAPLHSSWECLIRTQHALIRGHCALAGLPRPADVPAA